MFDTFVLVRKNVVVAPQACQGLSTLILNLMLYE
jgi:hypothetical protein